MKFVLHF